MSDTCNDRDLIHEQLDAVLSHLGLNTDDMGGAVTLVGRDPIVESRHKLGTAPALVIAAFGVAIASLLKDATGKGDDVKVDLADAVKGLNGLTHFKVNDVPITHRYNRMEPGNTFFRTADNRQVYVTNVKPHQRNAMLQLLDVPNSNEALARAIAKWKGEELETAAAELKIPISMVRTREEWLGHPQGQWAADNNFATTVKVANGDPIRLRTAPRPLSGVKVLEGTHLLAGPNVGRTFAEQGADVLRVAPPYQSDFLHFVMDTGMGKRSCFLDLDDANDRATFERLFLEADVFVQNFSRGSFNRRGIDLDSLTQSHRGIVRVENSCYGADGPWKNRVGYDPNAQSVTGTAATEGSLEEPKRPPTLFLADYLTGFVAAAAGAAALLRRTRDGGSYIVSTSLVQTCTWVQSLGQVDPASRPSTVAHARIGRMDSGFGELQFLAPIAQFTSNPSRWDRPCEPLGASRPEWLESDSARQ